MTSGIKKWAKKSSTLRKLARRHYAKNRYFDWARILVSAESQWCPGKGTPKILIPTSVGYLIGSTHIESLLGIALTLRGAQVEFALCDAALPACLACEFWFLGDAGKTNSDSLSTPFCDTCHAPAKRSYSGTGLKIRSFGEWLTSKDIAQCRNIGETTPTEEIVDFVCDGLTVGEHAYAGALRFFARGGLGAEPAAESVLRQYLTAAILTSRIFDRILEQNHYDCVTFNHGIYVPQGIIGALCRQRGIRVVNWNPAYRKRCFIFSHRDTYHHTMVTEPVEKWEHIDWNRRRERKLTDYLDSRRRGSGDWIWFHKKPVHRVDGTLEKMGVDFSKPAIGMLTSVVWDAALHYPDSAFPDMLTWVFETIDYFSTRPDLQLIIRAHPAEVQGGLPSRQKVWDEIKSRYQRLPSNVVVIGPENPLSTYSIMERCDSVIIYNTKTGIELAAAGIPVIVAGEAWIRNKGFSIDVSDPEAYRQVLDRLPKGQRMNDADTLRAKKYAYHFFFRRMIPLEFMEPARGNPPFRLKLNSLEALKPGNSRGLDLICDGILKGTDFIYDDPGHPA